MNLVDVLLLGALLLWFFCALSILRSPKKGRGCGECRGCGGCTGGFCTTGKRKTKNEK